MDNRFDYKLRGGKADEATPGPHHRAPTPPTAPEYRTAAAMERIADALEKLVMLRAPGAPPADPGHPMGYLGYHYCSNTAGCACPSCLRGHQ